MLITCYEIKLIIKERREGRIENERMGNNFSMCLITDRKGRVLFIDKTCNP